MQYVNMKKEVETSDIRSSKSFSDEKKAVDLRTSELMFNQSNNGNYIKIIVTEAVSSLKYTSKAFLIGLLSISVMLISIGPEYDSDSTLLVFLSSDYSPHDAGEDVNKSSIVLERDAILKDEVEILLSRSLAKATIQKLGISTIYPNLEERDNIINSIVNYSLLPINYIKSVITGTEMTHISPIEKATTKFLKNITAIPDKSGNIIKVVFSHHNPKISTKVLNTHIDAYLLQRVMIFRDAQSFVLTHHVGELEKKLQNINKIYSQFKINNNISDYNTQKQIYLHQRGEIQQDIQQADRSIAQSNQKSDFIQRELDQKPNDIVRYHDKTTQIRRGRVQVLDALEVDKSRSDQELVGNRARKESDIIQLNEINNKIKMLDKQEINLDDIERSRKLTEESYHSAMKALTDREMHENLMENKTANVRVIQYADIPIKPNNQRLIIFIVGFIASILLSIVVGIYIYITRKGFISDAAIVRSLNLPVLITMNAHLDKNLSV